nr:molybdate ABC transporter substrate-binding protein [uncultured Gellertiella sp.]
MLPTSVTRRTALALGFLALFGGSVVSASGVAQAADKPVTVFAAASLKDVLTSLAKSWKTKSGKDVTLSFAASSALARQIEAGAPADLFISADLKWMDHVEKAGLIDTKSRENLLANQLVLVGGKDAAAVDLKPGVDLGKLVGTGKLAVGLVKSVPAGIYAMQALEKLKAWDGVRDKLAESENVRAALTLVARGEAPYGIVYVTDAKAEKNVRQVGIFPEDSHDPIVYPAALTRAAMGSDAADFLAYLDTKAATKTFEAAGFTVLAHK